MTTGLIEAKADSIIPDDIPSRKTLEFAANYFLMSGRVPDPEFAGDEERHGLRPWDAPTGFRVNAQAQAPMVSIARGSDVFRAEARYTHCWADRVPEGLLVRDDGLTHVFNLARSEGTGHHHAHDGDILSPMPGKIIAVEVALGDAVTKGQKLLTLEAMKMEHTLTAPFDGVVAELSAVAGAQVQVEALLARIEAVEQADG